MKPIRNHSRPFRNIGWEKFIEAWQTSNSYTEVGEKLEMAIPITAVDKAWMAQRSSKARKNGVPLKKFFRGRTRPSIDWAALTELAKELK